MTIKIKFSFTLFSHVKNINKNVLKLLKYNKYKYLKIKHQDLKLILIFKKN